MGVLKNGVGRPSNETYKKMYGENKNAYKGFASNPTGGSYGYSKSNNLYAFLSCVGGGEFPDSIFGFKNTVKKGNVVKVDLTVETSSDDLFEKYKDKIDTEYT